MKIDWIQALPYVICASVLLAIIWACRRIAGMLFQNRWSRAVASIALLTTPITALLIGTGYDVLMLGSFILSIACLLTLERTHHYRWAALALMFLWSAALLHHAALMAIMPLLVLIFYLLPHWKFCYVCVAAKVLVIMGLVSVSWQPNTLTGEWFLRFATLGVASFQTLFDGTQSLTPQTPHALLIGLSLGGILLIFMSFWFGFKQSHNTLRPTALAIVTSGWLMLLPLFIIAPNPPMRYLVWPIATAIISALMLKQKPQKTRLKAKQGGHKPKSWD